MLFIRSIYAKAFFLLSTQIKIMNWLTQQLAKFIFQLQNLNTPHQNHILPPFPFQLLLNIWEENNFLIAYKKSRKICSFYSHFIIVSALDNLPAFIYVSKSFNFSIILFTNPKSLWRRFCFYDIKSPLFRLFVINHKLLAKSFGNWDISLVVKLILLTITFFIFHAHVL